jgi:hypothetical protein
MKLKINGLLSAGVLIASVLLSGCASKLYEGRLSWQDGWRDGTVIDVGAGAVLAKKLAKICKDVPINSSTRYATITHKDFSRRIWITIPIPIDSSLKVNDTVFVNLSDCSKGVELKSS